MHPHLDPLAECVGVLCVPLSSLSLSLADESGAELASYDLLWQLPRNERIHSKAYKAHGISAAQVQRDGVASGPEVGEFFALVAAVRAAGGRIVAHNASFVSCPSYIDLH